MLALNGGDSRVILAPCGAPVCRTLSWRKVWGRGLILARTEIGQTNGPHYGRPPAETRTIPGLSVFLVGPCPGRARIGPYQSFDRVFYFLRKEIIVIQNLKHIEIALTGCRSGTERALSNCRLAANKVYFNRAYSDRVSILF